ncbi:ABC transporter permease [Proteinivorax hydrogeniformans]|uniref:ABC transporter permease n=1 Tax=Proteinivorax hydrogeniformans TaxID=1826727 RepID=A0AAU8HS94_9FIRM
MKNFLIVVKFELLNFVKSKPFIASTVIICLMLAIGLSIPTIRDTFFSSDSDPAGEETHVSQREYGYVNKDEAVSNIEDLKNNFYLGTLVEYENQKELEEDVTSGDIDAGYVIDSPTSYVHIVKNNELHSNDNFAFEGALAEAYRIQGFSEKGIDYGSVQQLISVQLQSDTKILGTDSAGNYMYTYILTFLLYFVIIIYGQLVATSIASEKSNRAMEVLVTSTDSRNLIFGKVIGGALAGVIQFAIVIGTAFLAYELNSAAWDGGLDFVFNIPTDVLLLFSVFGILGYLFYLFIFGALGALVSRSEDVNTSATPITIIFVAVFFVSVTGMQNTEGLLIKVASYIPFSSFMAMFVRVSMGTVSHFEVILSLFILTLSTVIVGLLASKIYRLGTLMYGNPVKLTRALKLLARK